MKVDSKKFTTYNYTPTGTSTLFEVGDVVSYKELGEARIGVVLQIQGQEELRVDMDGSIDVEYANIRMATLEEVFLLRNDLIEAIVEVETVDYNPNVYRVLLNSIFVHYVNTNKVRQLKMQNTVKTQLDKHYNGLEKIGFGLDKDYVTAGEIFLKLTGE